MSLWKDTNAVAFTIPWIDGSIHTTSSKAFAQQEREKLDRLINSPSTISWWALLGKIGIGLVIGALMAVLLFVLFWAVGSLVSSGSPKALGLGTPQAPHELSWLIKLFLGFIISFIGNLLLITAYGLFFSQKYSNLGKSIGLLLLTNAILSIGMLALFLIFQGNAQAPILLFVLYVCLSLFLSFSQIEFVVNPNYAASSLMGNVVGLCISLIVLSIAFAKSIDISVANDDSEMLMLLTPIFSFPLMIFGQGIWEIIYAKMYENGANPFYLPSRAELDRETLLEQQQQEFEQEKINIELE